MNSGLFKKGVIPWNKGKKLIQLSGKNHWNWMGKSICECGAKKFRASKKCKKCELPQRREMMKKIQKTRTENIIKLVKERGFLHTKEEREKLSKAKLGRLNPQWKGGVTLINDKARKCLEYKLWKDGVYSRDCNQCQRCGENVIDNLVAHHILNFSNYIELRYAIDNGITFCKNCHRLFHKKFGRKNNNLNQVREFIKKD